MREFRRGFFTSEYTTMPSGGMAVIGRTYYSEKRINWGNVLGLIAAILSISCLITVIFL